MICAVLFGLGVFTVTDLKLYIVIIVLNGFVGGGISSMLWASCTLAQAAANKAKTKSKTNFFTRLLLKGILNNCIIIKTTMGRNYERFTKENL